MSNIKIDGKVNDFEKEYIALCWAHIKPFQKKDYHAKYLKVVRG